MRTLPAARVVAQGRALTSMSQGAGTKVYAHSQAANGGPSSLSQLFEVVRAKEPYSGRALAPQQVQEICSVIENISLEDLGVVGSLGQALQYGKAGAAREQRFKLRPRSSRGTVTYLDIHDDPTMTIGIFQLPPGARMPLHDHPGMTVFSRLLYGTLHVRAYDWVDPLGSEDTSSSTGSNISSTSGSSDQGIGSGSRIRPARLVTDRVLSAPADTMVLFPRSGGNIHAFTAISPCAILDVLTPPYGARNCTYYREIFPPQWLDAEGRPTIVPSEDVASWVAWQQAGSRQQQTSHADLNNSATAGINGSSSYCGINGVANGESCGGQEIIVGLEEWKEPTDFHVARGLYTGQRVTVTER